MILIICQSTLNPSPFTNQNSIYKNILYPTQLSYINNYLLSNNQIQMMFSHCAVLSLISKTMILFQMIYLGTMVYIISKQTHLFILPRNVKNMYWVFLLHLLFLLLLLYSPPLSCLAYTFKVQINPYFYFILAAIILLSNLNSILSTKYTLNISLNVIILNIHIYIYIYTKFQKNKKNF